jgi:hypothetical protein
VCGTSLDRAILRGTLELEAAAAKVQHPAFGGAPTDGSRQRVEVFPTALLHIEQASFT